MTEIVGLIGFIRRIRESYDPADHEILNPELVGLHYFYKSMLMSYELRAGSTMSWNPTDIAMMLRGVTLQHDTNFAMSLVSNIITHNREASIQDLLSKAYWLCRNRDGDAVYQELLDFYEDEENYR